MKPIKFSTISGKWRSIMITDKALVLSNKEYKSMEAMIPSLTGTAVMEDKEEIWYQSLIEINYLTNGKNLILKRLDFRNNPVTTTVILNDIEIIDDLVKVMCQEESFIKSEEKADTFRVAKISLFKAILTAVLTGVIFMMGNDIANGQGVNLSEKKS